MQKKLFFKNSRGKRLCGVLSNPTYRREKPVIILCHGLKSSKESQTYLRLEKILNKAEISTFRFDFYGHGESDGKFDELNPSEAANEEVDDVQNAIKFLKETGYEKIGLMGSSFGGMASIMAASASNDVFLLALKSPVSEYLGNAAKKIKIPTLIVHGSDDEVVPVEQSKKTAGLIKNCRLEIIRKADHRYSEPEDFEKMIFLISRFIIKNCEGLT